MVEGEITVWQHLPAVLAREVIAREDVGPAKAHPEEVPPHIPAQPDHCRERIAVAGGPNGLWVVLKHIYAIVEIEDDGTLPPNGPKWPERRVEEQGFSGEHRDHDTLVVPPLATTRATAAQRDRA